MLPPVLQEIPFSTVFILLLAASISLLTSLANRLLTNPEKSKAWRKEIAEWNTELRKAQRDGDKKRTEKLMKSKADYEASIQDDVAINESNVSVYNPTLLNLAILGRILHLI